MEGGYRYGYQGEFAEKEGEMPGVNSFELRLWDARIGRWLTTDPYGEFFSPYLGMANNPISTVDPDGGCTDPPCDEAPMQYLNEVVITANGGGGLKSNGFDFSGMPDFLRRNQPETWNTSYTKDLTSYNSEFGTNYTEGNQLNQWYYQNYYKPEYDDLISSMHAATNQAADIILQTAMAIAPVPKIGLFGRFGSRLLGNTRIPVYRVYGGQAGRFGRSWTFINPSLYGSTFRNFAGLPTNGLLRNHNAGTLMIRGSVQLKNISSFRMALPIKHQGTFGRLVPEVLIDNSWEVVKWLPKNVTRVSF